MSIERIDEPIDIRVDFCGKNVIPRTIRWNNKIYPINSINMVHSANNGESKLFFFSVSDKTNYFKLQFNTQSLEWRLIEMYAE